MKIKNHVLRAIDGSPLIESDTDGTPRPEAGPVTLAKVLTVAAMSRRPNNQPLTERENVERLMVAIGCQKAKIDEELEIESGVASALKTDVQSMYGPLIAGQVALLLEGKDLPF